MPITTQDLLKPEVAQFAQLFFAFQECTEEVQTIVIQMAGIVNDPESTHDEREHALEVLVEALVPGLACELLNSHLRLLKTSEFLAAKEQVSQQEHRFANKVRELMESKGMTQEELAERTGVSQPAISNILNRRCRPQQRTVLRFAEALEVSPEVLWPATT